MNHSTKDRATTPLFSFANQPKPLRWLLLVFFVYLMLVAVGLIGGGFKIASKDYADELFAYASNPILGLIIGMVCTALIQSSSTVSSTIVAMVAGGLPINIAIPMMMGANIGTSITNTIVSLGHIADKDEFQRAFNAATIHDFFNVLSVLIFLPLEIYFGVLESISSTLVNLLYTPTQGVDGFNPLKAATAPLVGLVSATIALVPNLSDVWIGVLKALFGLGFIVLAITYMGKIMKSLMVGRAKEMLQNSLGRGPLTGIGSGTLVTVLVQSSSTTTSLMVPLVGNGIVTARSIYPFTLGANIGTTITAIIAAMAVSGPTAVLAMQIALVHFCYNALAVTLIYGLPFTREIPPTLSYRLSLLVAENKLWGITYIAGLFFILPLSVIFLFG